MTAPSPAIGPLLTEEERRRTGAVVVQLNPTVGADAQICEDELAEDFTAWTKRPGSPRLIYCAQRMEWYTLKPESAIWREDTTLEVWDLIRARNRARLIELADRADDAAKKQAVKEMRAARNSRAIAGVERLLRSDRHHAVDVDSLDANPMLLNTPQGVVDLESGELVGPMPEELMTKCARATPRGACPTWERFINEITAGDADLAAFLQRVAGYALTGLTKEHALFFLYGTGANGKSTFLVLLLYILGDYAVTAPAETFIEARGERHPTELAMLRGARLVVAQEIDAGRQWALSRIKSLTGGEPIAARVMRGDFFTFTPTFKLVLAGNHRPGLRNVDEAIRRRLHMLPFTVTIPAAQRNPHLVEDLKLEADGILAWMVRGCVMWQRRGLAPPAAVVEATAGYLDAENTFGAWLEERTRKDASADIGSAELYHDYAKWMERCGEHPGSNKAFSKTMEEHGFARSTDRRGARFRGVSLNVAGNEGLV